MIKQATWDALHRRMQALGIKEEDLVERFILGRGSGGQKINKTHSCVHLKHPPSKLEVRCQKSRQRADNRYHARVRLCDKLEEQIFQKQSKKQQAIEKVRRQKRKRSKRAQEKMLHEKHKRSKVKQLRSKLPSDDA